VLMLRGQKAEARDAAGCVITSATSRACKRKLEDSESTEVNTQHENNISVLRPPAGKRIRREKTGTDWQSVLDIVKYSEERQGLAAAVKQREATAAVWHDEIRPGHDESWEDRVR
jgi:hypothetical protein